MTVANFNHPPSFVNNVQQYSAQQKPTNHKRYDSQQLSADKNENGKNRDNSNPQKIHKQGSEYSAQFGAAAT